MRKSLVLVLVLVLASTLSAQVTQTKPQEKQAPVEKQIEKQQNVCYVPNVEAVKGSSFPVKVFVTNIDTLAGMQVPIYYRSENVDLKCDSISFDGSRCQNFALVDYKIEPQGKTAYFSFIYNIDPSKDLVPLLPGDGLVATLWFTAAKDATPGQVTLDSGPNAFYPNEKIDYSYLFWTPSAVQVDCAYHPGNITVK